MKVFVWENVEQVSNNWHSDGGVVVFANDESRAREIANSTPGCNIKDNEVPSDIRDLRGSKNKEAVYIFPNAGCC